jgi:hypothetical protein
VPGYVSPDSVSASSVSASAVSASPVSASAVSASPVLPSAVSVSPGGAGDEAVDDSVARDCSTAPGGCASASASPDDANAAGDQEGCRAPHKPRSAGGKAKGCNGGGCRATRLLEQVNLLVLATDMAAHTVSPLLRPTMPPSPLPPLRPTMPPLLHAHPRAKPTHLLAF